jgi:hypothetical protein
MIKGIIYPIFYKNNEKKQHITSVLKSNSNIGKIIDLIIVYTESPNNDDNSRKVEIGIRYLMEIIVFHLNH